jgi:hypothetical protein
MVGAPRTIGRLRRRVQIGTAEAVVAKIYRWPARAPESSESGDDRSPDGA